MSRIQSYHAHVYFDQDSYQHASQLCDRAGTLFDVEVGRKHRRNVGPHPCWSCQLAFAPAVFAELVPWLALNRDGLTVFIHPNTGDELSDHTAYAMWMGRIEPLNLDLFKSTA